MAYASSQSTYTDCPFANSVNNNSFLRIYSILGDVKLLCATEKVTEHVYTHHETGFFKSQDIDDWGCRFLKSNRVKTVIRYLLILTVLFAAGCSQDTAEYDELFYRNGRLYKGDSEQPFSGIAYDHWDNGQARVKQPFRDGKEHGWSTTWYEDGRKSSMGESSNGEQIGDWTFWDRDGDELVRNFDD
jgi:hypothetical protein